MEEFATKILAGIGAALLAGGALTAMAYWLFKLLADKWLTGKFNERLEAFKHQQQKELEQLRFNINALMDRATKLHQRQFDVLPEAWALLMEAYEVVSSLVHPAQQYPDLDRMTGPELDEFLETSELSKSEKEQFGGAKKRTDLYIKIIQPYKIGKAKSVSGKFYSYFRKGGIFISAPLKGKFKELDDLIHAALVEHETNLQMQGQGGLRLVAARDALSKQGKPKLDELETAVAGRLWNAATDNAM